MTSDRDKPRRWQFGIGGLMLLTAAAVAPLITFRMGQQLPMEIAGWLYLIVFCLGGGVIMGTIGWLMFGTRGGFVAGYIVGSIAGVSVASLPLMQVAQ